MEGEQGSEALLGAIDKRAEQERARLIAEAEEEARRTLARAEAEADAVRAAARAGLERELEAEQRRLVGEARLGARLRALTARRAVLSEAFRLARERLDQMKRGPDWKRARSAMSEEARAAVGEPCTLECSDAEGRVIASSADGRRRVENSLDGRLRRVQSAAEHEVARRLFGGPTGPGGGG
jgi:vacuolar-type H+-ATPase subunit E/Vma4